MEKELVIFWFRRDLRLEDNVGLWHALTSGFSVLPVFIYDSDLLSTLEPDDKRMTILGEILRTLDSSVRQRGSAIFFAHGRPLNIFKELVTLFKVKALYFNRDYEPFSIKRDGEVTGFMKSHGIACYSYKDQVIFEGDEILKNDGKPYTVFTPYSVKWLSKFSTDCTRKYTSEKLTGNFVFNGEESYIPPGQLGFRPQQVSQRPVNLGHDFLRGYAKKRDFPAIDGTSNIGPHLRFGTISVREAVRRSHGISDAFVKELIWREFFMQILFHFPFVTERSFRAGFDRIEWVNDEEKFNLWCEGRTGFQIIDAGMRELISTGYMHNRVRMIVSNFLTRHLLTDWKWGEAWFAEKLIDFELSSNNGNWQWAAGSGCDAAQYFRIFNPDFQLKKFDPRSEYCRKWIPELGTPGYAKRCVDLSEVREKALTVYKSAIYS
ncbi:MAG TPA: deoxyribodipyrimidine photo-lyase [Bacteroidales bacterium]|nr:deoxyribodipyrimidine photo-lyase [Bacteroidales bacterium]